MKSIFILLLFLILVDLAHAQGTRLPLYGDGKQPYQTTIDTKNIAFLEYVPADDKAKNGSAVLLLPGGGYSFVSVENEGYPVANWLSQNGFATFILHYRRPDSASQSQPYWVPMTDAMTAMRVIRGNAQSMGVNPAKVGVIGFSAGGHLAGSLSTLLDKHPTAGEDEMPPNFAVLVYPVITMLGPSAHAESHHNLLSRNPPAYLDTLFSLQYQVTPKTPPTYLVHSQNDNTVLVDNTLMYHKALSAKNIPTSLNVYPNGGHGYAIGKVAPTWWPPCMVWLKEQVAAK